MNEVSPEQVARRIALLLRNSKETRARISEKTVTMYADKERLRMWFIVRVRESLEELGICMVELERGGFGLLEMRVLEGAKVLTP